MHILESLFAVLISLSYVSSYDTALKDLFAFSRYFQIYLMQHQHSFFFFFLAHLYFILPLKNILSFTAYVNSRLYTLSLDHELDKYNNLVIFQRFRLALMFSYCIFFIESTCNVYIRLSISIYLILQNNIHFTTATFCPENNYSCLILITVYYCHLVSAVNLKTSLYAYEIV